MSQTIFWKSDILFWILKMFNSILEIKCSLYFKKNNISSFKTYLGFYELCHRNQLSWIEMKTTQKHHVFLKRNLTNYNQYLIKKKRISIKNKSFFMDAFLYKVLRLCCTSLKQDRLRATLSYVTRLATNNILFHIFPTMDIINNAIGEYQQMVGRFYILTVFYVVNVGIFQWLSIHFL